MLQKVLQDNSEPNRFTGAMILINMSAKRVGTLIKIS
jgi:hypothetical protein